MKLTSFEAIVAVLDEAGVRYLVIHMKERAGRPQDMVDVEHLRMRLKGDAGH